MEYFSGPSDHTAEEAVLQEKICAQFERLCIQVIEEELRESNTIAQMGLHEGIDEFEYALPPSSLTFEYI